MPSTYIQFLQTLGNETPHRIHYNNWGPQGLLAGGPAARRIVDLVCSCMWLKYSDAGKKDIREQSGPKDLFSYGVTK